MKNVKQDNSRFNLMGFRMTQGLTILSVKSLLSQVSWFQIHHHFFQYNYAVFMVLWWVYRAVQCVAQKKKFSIEFWYIHSYQLAFLMHTHALRDMTVKQKTKYDGLFLVMLPTNLQTNAWTALLAV